MTDGKIQAMRLLVIGAAALLLWETFSKMHAPLAEWDHVALTAAKQWTAGAPHPWEFDHPPLYPFYLTVVFKFLGPGVEVARLGNLLSVLLSAFILFRLSREMFGRHSAYWSVLLYLLNPVTIQGIGSMDMADTSLLPLLFLLVAGSMRKITARPGLVSAVGSGLWFGVCFWGKITSSLGWAAALIAGYIAVVIHGKKIDDGKRTLALLAGPGLGIILFMISWSLVSLTLWGRDAWLFPLKTVWTALLSQQDQGGSGWSVGETAYHALRISVWFSPFLLFAWLISTWGVITDRFPGDGARHDFRRILAWGTLVYFAVHLVLGGTNWGFPRYHAPVVPFVSMFFGFYASDLMRKMRDRSLFLSALCVLVIIGLHAAVAHDPILFLNLTVKKMLLAGDTPMTILTELLAAFTSFYGLPLVASLLLLFFLREKETGKGLKTVVLVCVLSTVLTLDITQGRAPYRTGVQYGAVGKASLLRKVRSHIEYGDYVFGTPEFSYALKDKGVPYVGWRWSSRDAFYQVVQERKPSAIIAGLTVNTLGQLRWLLSEETLRFLKRDYSLHRIGTYYLWLRVSGTRLSEPA